MSIDIIYDRERQVLIISAVGPINFDDFTSAFETIVNSNEYSPNTNAIWDLRKADFSSASMELWEGLIEHREQFSQRTNCRSAIIVDSTFQYGMVRMFQNQAGDRIPQEFMVFRDYKEGEKWLLEKH